jgi:hypothetical protein
MFNRRDGPTTTVGLPSASEGLNLQLPVKQLKRDLLSQPPPRIVAPVEKLACAATSRGSGDFRGVDWIHFFALID